MTTSANERQQATMEIEQAWEEFRATGQYAKPEDVEDWLNSWGSKDEQPLPLTTSAKPLTESAPSTAPA